MGALLPAAGDFAVVPVAGWGGAWIGAGQLAAGYWRHPGLSRYRHAFVYVGLLSSAEARDGVLEEHGWSGPGAYCYEAMPGGSRLRRLGFDAGTAWEVYGESALWSTGRLDLEPQQRRMIVSAALGKLGTPYSLLDYISLVQYHLHIPGPGLRDFIADQGHQICSQAVDWLWQQAGRRIVTGCRWDGDVMPADLAAVLLRS